MTIHNPKILYFHMEYPPILGGGASYTKNLISELNKLQAQIILVTNGLSDSLEKVNTYLTIKRYKVFYDMYYGKGSLLQGVDILLQQIREESPDILHTVYIEETLIGQIANLNYGIPHIVTHTKTPMYREESIKKNSTWSLFDYVNRNISVTYIAPGIAYRDSLLGSGVENDSIHLIYPGIDQNKFKKIRDSRPLCQMRKRLNIEFHDSVLLIPCRLRKRKGLNFVSEALSKLSVPNHNIKVIITGIPEDQEEHLIYQDFKNRIGNIKVVEHTKFSDEDMPILYNIADITVLCSEAEGYGTVFLEAMACECPVIGSDVIGINESIKNGYNGILCKYGDHNSLNNAILKILTDEKTRKRYTRNALSFFKTKRNLRKQAKSHLKLYKAVCNHNQQSTFALYRSVNNHEEVYLLKQEKSVYSLPKIPKKTNESWLQATIKAVWKNTGYKVTIPSHLILDKTDKKNFSYSFKITTDTPHIDSDADEGNSGMWLDLRKTTRLVASKNDKNILQQLEFNLRNDRLVKQGNL
ncbi:MAG: glycosyltransferase family 4 protein [Patescibacteria group bacterium]